MTKQLDSHRVIKDSLVIGSLIKDSLVKGPLVKGSIVQNTVVIIIVVRLQCNIVNERR